ncbi:Hypothetical predicted protein [Mytilus galloprovincialis]|uniref:Mitochondria-eating protein C-terminal domain-containing protein n=1 Tax=Mytilus galloprovincialis TaxID=29158 RepID=A0A8B6ESC9_MYTGA|nr:Hypothetical predicted protein [Mytilus galloprovincialis]
MLGSLWSLCLEDPFTSAFNIDQPKETKLKQLPENLIVELKQRRRIEYTECVKSATQKFKEIVLVKNPKYQSKKVPAVDAYIDKCIELFWLMSVQDPPMVIRWPKADSPFDGDNYKEYCRKGRKVKIAVWPAVYLHEKGALMNKGFAMPY